MTVDSIVVGKPFTGMLQIKGVNKGETKTGQDYIFLKCGDITGDILVKIWSVEKELMETLLNNSIGNFIKVDGLLGGEYRGNKELTSQGGAGLTYVTRVNMELDPTFDISDYTIGAPFTREDMMNGIIHDMRYEITNLEVKRLVATIFDKYKDVFEVQPAAISMHHDYEEGLLYHTYNMLRVGKSLADLYPHVNKSLLLAGIILHDMGKVVEYKKNTDTGGYDFSIKGNLLGHISIMSSEIEEVGKDLGISEEIVTNLQHIVLSHHGNLEWGSPVLPKTPEAILVHYIDNMDSKMEQVRSAMIGYDKGEMTNRVYGLGNVSMYIPDVEE